MHKSLKQIEIPDFLGFINLYKAKKKLHVFAVTITF
jgi:hypothetical protein